MQSGIEAAYQALPLDFPAENFEVNHEGAELCRTLKYDARLGMQQPAN
jgi:hypothetical protein